MGVMNGMQKLVVGENYIVQNDGKISVHAEEDAIGKFLRIRDAPKKIHVLVIRLSKTGQLGSSRPCKNCLTRYINISRKFKLKIKNVYYSTSDGTIERENFITMLDSELTHISSGYRHCGWRDDR